MAKEFLASHETLRFIAAFRETLDPVLSEMNRVHTITPYLFNINVNIVLPSMPKSGNKVFITVIESGMHAVHFAPWFLSFGPTLGSLRCKHFTFSLCEL